MPKNNKGQISIFFSTTVVVMITFIAFIINIGIFVKAKINLQNATDAAAYAGASVQARQLTNIAYMNWEMRNIYKEWMFKYYVIGGLNLENVNGSNPDSEMSFRMTSSGLAVDSAGDPIEDFYNFPSSCVDFSGSGGVGLCTKYTVPGLPRFESSNVLGMDETTNAFVDSIVSEKANDCSERTKLNFLTANTWSYNVNTNDSSLNNIKDIAPEIGTDRMGAFPQAFEIALRIRNLEAQVNHPPINGVCQNTAEGINCSTIASSLNTPSKERALKAYLSGWKNLATSDDNFMKNSFTLKEVSPNLDTSFKTSKNLSTTLIPSGKQALNKFYLDLKLMTINYATFYTAFTPKSGKVVVDGQEISAEGECVATKIGLPVPGYPLGYIKNPDLLTYYAVEAKVNFVGLFNPFAKDIELSAYAAAKPFGGRIGPMLFDVNSGALVKSRSNQTSSSYISALDVGNTGVYEPGNPVPINIDTSANGRFWLLDSTDAVGGIPGSGDGIFFGIPNMVWDYPNGTTNNKSLYVAKGSENVEIITKQAPGAVDSQSGLFNRDMFEAFKSRLVGIGGSVTSASISDALTIIRAPTLYETHNYLIPSPEDVNQSLLADSWGSISGPPVRVISDGSTDYNIYEMKLYAPIFSDQPTETIYESAADLASVLDLYLKDQERAINKYKNSMNIVAASIFNNNSSGATGQNTGRDAASQVSDLTPAEYGAIGTSITNSDAAKPTCASIAGKFIFFFSGDTTNLATDAGCGTSLKELMQSRWEKGGLTGDIYQEFSYALPVGMTSQLFTAYRPGPRHDAGRADGVVTNVLTKKQDTMIRNFYSTKFIPMKSLTISSAGAYGPGKMPIYSEGETSETNSDNETQRKTFRNPVEANNLSRDLQNLHH